MKRLIFSILLLYVSVPALQAQAPAIRKNTLHLDFLGPGIWGSIGYFRDIPCLSRPSFRTSVGLAPSLNSANFEGRQEYNLRMNPELNLLFFKGNHHLETGIIPSLFFSWDKYHGETSRVRLGSFLIPNLRLGWRYEKPDALLFFRAGISTITFEMYDVGLLYWPWPYVGTGFRF